jgi:hypothetical protein
MSEQLTLLLSDPTSSAAASPARPSRVRARPERKPIIGGCGRSLSGFCACYDRALSSWRTYPACSGQTGAPPSETCSVRWPTSGTMRSGVVSERATLEHRTDGTGSSSSDGWQTPGADSFRSRGGERKGEAGLDRQARTWPSPTAGMETPEDMAQARYAGNGGKRPAYAMTGLPGPTTQTDGATISSGIPTVRPPGRVLSPSFVEALMGFPDGWTLVPAVLASVVLATRSCRRSRKLSDGGSRALRNGKG